MVEMHVILDGDGCWPDLVPVGEGKLAKGGIPVIHLANDAPPVQVAALDGGMTSGRTSLTLRIDLPDGTVVLAETSLRLFLFAARALHAQFGDQE
jgi:hypothetical protein